MIKFAKKFKSRLSRRLNDTLFDQDTFVEENPAKYKLLWRTARYRIAGLGLAITENEKRLLSLKGKHIGQRAFIMGNGPSLNSCDLTLLKNEITFGVNSIYLNYEKMGFLPTYYVVEDTFVAEDRADEINNLKGPVKFFGNYLKYCINDSDDIIWLNVSCNYRDYENFPYFSKNAARILWVGGTVTYLCLQLSYFMGFSEIFLIGFDHNYTIPQDASVSGVDIISNSDDPNHFHPDYFGKGYRWHDPNVLRMETAYIRSKKIFENDGRKIFNATVGGKLEVFDRIKYTSLLNT